MKMAISQFQQLVIAITFSVDWCLGDQRTQQLTLASMWIATAFPRRDARGLFFIVLCIDAVDFVVGESVVDDSEERRQRQKTRFFSLF